jgi:hypothetical protein
MQLPNSLSHLGPFKAMSIYLCLIYNVVYMVSIFSRGCHGRMIVGFTNTCVISAYHHSGCELESHSWQGLLDTTL